MSEFHSLLKRQIRKAGLDFNSLPDEIKKLLEIVSGTYVEFDDDKKLLERSLDLSSDELLNANIELKETERLLGKHNQVLAKLIRNESYFLKELDEVIKEITETTASTLGVERSSVWFFAEDRNILKCIDLFNLCYKLHQSGEEYRVTEFPEYFSALDNDIALSVYDAINDSRTSKFAEHYYKPLRITSVLDVPIRVGNKYVGIFSNEHIGKKRRWLIEEQNFVSSMVEFLSLAIEKKELYKAETNLHKLSEAVEQSPNAVIIADAEGKIEYINNRFTQLVGFELNEIKGKTLSALNLLNIEISEYDKLSKIIKKGGEWKREVGIKSMSGGFYWLIATGAPIKDNENVVTHLLIIMEDITQRKLFEGELIRAKEDAENADRVKTEFLAQMSHEIRTPLNIILNYNSLIKFEVENYIEEELKLAFSSVDRASKRLVRTIDLILNMAEVQSKSYHVKFKKLDIYDTILGVFFEFESLAKDKGISLIHKKSTDQTEIFADEYTITQIFQNLVDNALKYTIKGSVEVIVYSKYPNIICIDVKDTGIGISEEYLPRLFLPFSQEDTGYTRRFEGNGLGLALVKNYVELNNGTIEVKSEKGMGTTFTVIFNRTSQAKVDLPKVSDLKKVLFN